MPRVEFAGYGVPHEVCYLVEPPEPRPPGPDEVTVTVQACAINPADLLIIEGRYPGPATLPAPIGIEGAGRVRAVGSAVTNLREGDPVMLLGRGNWATEVQVPAAQAIKIPAGLDMRHAAQLKVNPPTAMLMLSDYVALKAGDWVIQNAANSAVGRHVIRLARNRGIKTVNVVRRESLIEPLQALGADLVVVDGEDLGARVRAEIGEENLPLAIDAVAGGSCLHLADCLSDGGQVINYGFLSGDPCMITPTHTIVKSIELRGFRLANRLFQRPRDEIEAIYAEIAELFQRGVLVAPVEASYGLDQLREALAHAEREGRHGKILLTPAGPLPTTGG